MVRHCLALSVDGNSLFVIHCLALSVDGIGASIASEMAMFD